MKRKINLAIITQIVIINNNNNNNNSSSNNNNDYKKYENIYKVEKNITMPLLSFKCKHRCFVSIYN